MKSQGWHLEVFDTYYTDYNKGILYSATFRPGTENEIVVCNNGILGYKDNYYFKSGYADGWRIDQISVVSYADDACNDVIGHGVTEKKSFVEGEEANSDDFSSAGISLENSVTVYPTQSSNGQFTLKIDNVSDASAGHIEVYDLMGVKKDNATKSVNLSSGLQEFNVNLNGYESGAYIIKINIGEATLTKRIFIIE